MKKLALVVLIACGIMSCVGSKKSNCPAYSLTAIEKPNTLAATAAE